MSTNAVIAKPDGCGSWMGRYHHWDGYPAMLGVTLVKARHEHFGGDLAAMIKHLIDDEPVGWSSINVKNPAGPPSWTTEAINPQSYTARGEKVEEPYWIRPDGDTGGVRWCYVLRDHFIDVWQWGYDTRQWRYCGPVGWGDVARMEKMELE